MKKGFSICFLGIDGSGKSTLARHLCQELKHSGYNVNYVWWLKGDTSLLRRTLKAIGSSRFVKLEADAQRQKVVTKDTRAINRAFKSFFPKILIADYLMFGAVNAWLPRIAASNKVTIFDRFMYDVILALSKEFEMTRTEQLRLFRLFSILLPQPDLVFLIDVPPEVCYIRKKQEIDSVQESRDMWETYQILPSVLGQLTDGRIVHVDNTRNPLDVNEDILATTLELLEGGDYERKTGNNWH